MRFLVATTMLCAFLATSSGRTIREDRHEEDQANMTFYDDECGGTGIKFSAYPIEWHSKSLYPIAVHQKDFRELAYKILKISVPSTDRTLYGHVTDMCDRDDESCRNAFEHDKNFLIDLHESGWKAAGIDDGIVAASYEVVGSLRPQELPDRALDGYVFCECADASCDLEDAIWKPRGRC